MTFKQNNSSWFPSGPMTSPDMDFGPGLQRCEFFSVEQTSKAVSHPVILVAGLHQYVVTFYLVGSCCSMQMTARDKTVDIFCTTVTCTELFGTVKASQQVGRFQGSSNLISPCPATQVHDVFNRSLLSIVVAHQEQWQQLSCLDSLQRFFVSKTYGGCCIIPHLAMRFSFINPCLLRLHCLPM